MLSFRVENLGRVSDAEISTSPLTILVGRNNTGKSYVASTIWALSNLWYTFLRQLDTAARPKWFEQFARRKGVGKTKSVFVSEKEADEVLDYLNEVLKESSSQFFSALFAYDGFENSRIILEKSGAFRDFFASITLPEQPKEATGRAMGIAAIGYSEDETVIRTRYPVPGSGASILHNILYRDIVGQVLFGTDWVNARNAVYIPAARTGLMLAMPALVSHALDAETDRPTLPLPLTDFLQFMSYPGIPRRSESTTADYLAESVVHGSIDAKEDPTTSFSYRPDGCNVSLPMHATSSMITEVTPFLVLLRRSPRMVIFEEPEAHLHLAAQREMARTIVRLVNSGVRVVLTTHGDTFLQQINNLMHLAKHPKRTELMERLGYDQVDLLDPDQASAYEFTEKQGGTTVRLLSKENEGFVVPSLNEALVALTKETVMLHEED